VGSHQGEAAKPSVEAVDRIGEMTLAFGLHNGHIELDGPIGIVY